MSNKKLYGMPESDYKALCSAGVYKITCTPTNKVYIGGTTQSIKGRFAKHTSELNKNKHVNPYFQNAWNKYREENFVFEIIEICLDTSKIYVNKREQYYLDLYQSYNSGNGYNVNKKADRKSYSQQQKNQVALRKNPHGYLIYRDKNDIDPEQVFNLKDYCITNNLDYDTCFAVAQGRKKSYKGLIIRYADNSKNNQDSVVSEYSKYNKQQYIVLTEDLHPDYYQVNYVKQDNSLVSLFDKIEIEVFRKDVLNKIFKNVYGEKPWRIFNNKNETSILCNGLVEFAKKNELSNHNLMQVAYGQKKSHKGFGCKQLVPKEKLNCILK